MADVMPRRQCRDEVRYRLKRLTGIDAVRMGVADLPFGGSGEPYPGQPNPTNDEINRAIRDTISEINIKARLGGNEAPVSTFIPAQVAVGPYRVDIQTAFYVREGQVNEVKRVWWNDPTTPALRWTSDRDMDANRVNYQGVPPSLPESCWVTHGGLFISPSPASPGTLYAYVGKALHGPNTDDETIPGLAGDLYRVVLDGTAWRLALAEQDDKAMAARAQVYGPMYQDGIMDIKTTMGSFGQSNPRLIASPYRVTRGSR